MIDVNAADELDQFARLGALMSPFGVYRLSNQVDGHWIFPHLRCVTIPHSPQGGKNYPASQMRDNS
jgi:hypothetical protein